MKTRKWQPVGKVSLAKLREARLQAHNGAQWVARLAHSYLDHEVGDTHLDLTWDETDGALVGRDIGEGLSVGLDTADLALQFRENGKRVPHKIELDARSPAKVEAWFLVELLHRHRDRERFSKALPFEIAGLMTGDALDFSHESHAEGLAELARWQANAALLLRQIVGDKARIISSPYHFDIAAVVPIEGRGNAAVRAGFAPGDDRDLEPFFYISGSAVLASTAPKSMPRIGRIETRDLVAKALPVSQCGAGGKRALEFLRDGLSDARRAQAN